MEYYLGNISSLRYPRGNNTAEKAVGIANQMLNKNPDNLNLALSPIVSIGLSPAQLLMSRNFKEKLPMVTENLQPKMNNAEMIKEKLKLVQMTNKNYYDRNTRHQEQCKEGEDVLFKVDPNKP